MAATAIYQLSFSLNSRAVLPGVSCTPQSFLCSLCKQKKWHRTPESEPRHHSEEPGSRNEPATRLLCLLSLTRCIWLFLSVLPC